MAVTQETPPLTTAARRAATAAAVAANKAKAAPRGATNKPAAPVPGTATAKSRTVTATTIRLPPSTPTPAVPRVAAKTVTPTTSKPAAVASSAFAAKTTAAKTVARPSPTTVVTPKAPIVAKRSAAPSAATSSSNATTAAAAALRARTAAANTTTASAAPATRRTPVTASARTTTSIRVSPSPLGTAAKPPAVAGRPSVNMTPTTVRTPVRPPSTLSPVPATLKLLKSPAHAPPLRSGPSVARVGSATPTSATARNRVPTVSPAPIPKKAPTATLSTPLELKKAIASVKAKFDETSMRLQAKEEELASLGRQLETGSYLDTASSDGGETLVPEIDLSKISAQDKDVVVAVITSKEKELAKKKHQIRTLKARLERFRLEHEGRVKELNHKTAQRQSEKEAELASLHRDLADAIQKLDEVVVLRKKLDGSRSLHSSNIEELNRIHDDKLQSLELELQAAKQERLERTGGTGDEVQDMYRQDLEELKRSHEKRLTKILREHKEELERVKKQHEEEQKQTIDEHETELRERFESELTQIKASHTSLINGRMGAESGMAEVLQERHARTLEDLKVKVEKEHQYYLGSVQNKHQSDLERLGDKHSARVDELESKIKRLQGKLDADKITIRSKAEVQYEEMKNQLASEITRREEEHSEQMDALEASAKEQKQQEFDALQSRFSSFVADIQGSQDYAMKNLEGSYENRIAELIVEHEDRVQELENEANQEIERELERVEMEFEIDRERLAGEQSRKLADLKATHEAALNELEDKLTLAEERAKEAIRGIYQTKQRHSEEMAEVKADLEAQMSAVEISIEALVTARERDEKSATEALEAGHATVIGAGKATHEMNLSDALAKKETAWKTKNKPLINNVETLRSQLEETQLNRDHIRAELEATERRLREEFSSAVEVMHKDQNSRLEQREQATRTRFAKISKTHEEHADTHESKLADLLTSHHQRLQTLKDQQESLLEAREQAHQERIKTLEMSLTASGAAPGSETMLQAVQKALQEVAQIKKQNEILKDENGQLQQVANQLRAAMAL